MSLEQFPVKEKLVRLARDPSDAQSVFGFMGGYWHRFLQANSALEEVKEPIMVSGALQANAKVAFALWLQDKAAGTSHPESSRFLC
jgi:hypothetical protein